MLLEKVEDQGDANKETEDPKCVKHALYSLWGL
jgi:hypothetical protein